jgi:hypothetical protein
MRYGNLPLRAAALVDGLWCAFNDWPMGESVAVAVEMVD